MAQSISTIAQCLEIKNIASEVSNDKKNQNEEYYNFHA